MSNAVKPLPSADRAAAKAGRPVLPWYSWVIVALCAGATLVLWQRARLDAETELQAQFAFKVREVHLRIQERINNYRDLLLGAAGLFAASDEVTRSEFRTYTDTMRLPDTYPGIQGLGFARAFAPAQRDKLVTQIRREGYPEFALRPEGERDFYSAIVYIEPFDWRNQRAFGYDMYAEPVRREAMARARDEGGVAMSGRVTLVQETEKDVQSGFLMYLPVYQNGQPHDTLQDRRDHLLGWVYSPFRMDDLMTKGVIGKYMADIRDTLDIEIYDGNSIDPKQRMFDSIPGNAAVHARYTSQQNWHAFGRDWTVIVRSLPAFEASGRSYQAWAVLASGGTITLLLAWVVWLMASTQTRAVRLASRMSADLAASGAKLQQTLLETVRAIAAVVEMRDPFTAGHQRRVADLSQAIAHEMKLQPAQIEATNLAALAYEIGKVRVPAEILCKPAALDDLERELVQGHAQAGFEILSEIDFPWPIAQIVQQHHERIDGSGYPQGLKGDDIRLEARIIAVADVVDAMLSHRPYRPAHGLDAALAEITSQAGVRYDADVVNACRRLFLERGYRLPA